MHAATGIFSERGRGAARGFTLFELAVALAVIGTLAAVLLDRLSRYQEIAEKAAMEATVRLVRTALQIRLAELIVSHRQSQANELETANPMQWLEPRPVNYAGGWQPPGRPGRWYFDERTGELIYVADAASRLQIDTVSGIKVLRFRTKVTRNAVQVPGGRVDGVSGVTVSPVRAYRWP